MQQTILSIARRLMAHQGYGQVSFGTIAKEMGVNRANLFYYFPSKHDLGLALIHDLHLNHRQSWEALCKSDADPRTRLHHYLESILESLENQDCYVGCVAGHLVAELSDCDQEFQRQLALLFQEWMRTVAHVVSQGQRLGQFRADRHPEDIACQLIALLQGMALLIKVSPDPVVYQRTLRQALQDLDLHSTQAYVEML